MLIASQIRWHQVAAASWRPMSCCIRTLLKGTAWPVPSSPTASIISFMVMLFTSTVCATERLSSYSSSMPAWACVQPTSTGVPTVRLQALSHGQQVLLIYLLMSPMCMYQVISSVRTTSLPCFRTVSEFTQFRRTSRCTMAMHGHVRT